MSTQTQQNSHALHTGGHALDLGRIVADLLQDAAVDLRAQPADHIDVRQAQS